MKSFKLLSGALFSLLLLLAVPAIAQSINSAVEGSATDSTGAAIPGASVTLTNVNTGTSQNGVTDAAGNYSFPSVPLGYYNLIVTKPGFATYKLNNFNVIVGQCASENVKLFVATTQQEVNVNAGALADLLQPESSDLGTVGWTRYSVFNLGYTAPGVQAAVGITGTPDPNGITSQTITGYAGFGTRAGLLGDVDNSYQLHDAFNWLLGKHQLKIGADIAYVRTVDSSANISARGGLTYQAFFTQQLAQGSVKASGGNAFADYLLGTPSNGEAKGMPPTHYR